MVPVAPIITGVTFVFTFHMHCVSIVKSLYFAILSASYFITFLSFEIATSISIHFPFSLRCPVYCQEWFCQFALFHFITLLP
jgi:hypothetical protein